MWLVAAIVIAASAGLLLFGRWRWHAGTELLHRNLNAARTPAAASQYSERDLIGLPEPVRRYFLRALTDGQRRVRAVRISHRGQFNAGGARERWAPFISDQRVVTRRPGFVWDARIAMAPGLTVRVHDAYVAGQGELEAKLLGLIPVTTERPTTDLARGELMRYVAEAAWYPTALLPGEGVTWEPMDDRTSRVTFRDGEVSVSLVFSFDDAGVISAVRAEDRGRILNGVVTPTPWEGRWSRHEMCDGMCIPMEGEVAWLLPEGRQPYWRGRITRIVYEWESE